MSGTDDLIAVHGQSGQFSTIMAADILDSEELTVYIEDGNAGSVHIHDPIFSWGQLLGRNDGSPVHVWIK
jgi:hypothetical protein